MNKIKSTVLIMVAALLLTACQDKEEGKLDNRIIAYWNFKINKDFKNAYQFLSPGWKSNESELSYSVRMGMSRVKWLGVQVISKNCKQIDLCKVKVEIEYEYQFKGVGGQEMRVKTGLDENWIMKENTWYHVPSEAKL